MRVKATWQVRQYSQLSLAHRQMITVHSGLRQETLPRPTTALGDLGSNGVASPGALTASYFTCMP